MDMKWRLGTLCYEEKISGLKTALVLSLCSIDPPFRMCMPTHYSTHGDALADMLR